MKKQNIKKTIEYGDIRIHLIEPIPRSEMTGVSLSNIAAYDKSGNMCWRAETPKSSNDQYFDMFLDSNNNTLVATTALSYRHIINLSDGRVMDFSVVK